MSLFDNITKKAGELASSAAKKSGELVETAKLNISITNEQDKIEKLFLSIGEKVYSNYKSKKAFDLEYSELCNAIQASENEIIALKEKILQTKNQKICIGCGVEIDKASPFCAGCGAKQETTASVADSSVFCPGCGKKADPQQTFCSACGGKLS